MGLRPSGTKMCERRTCTRLSGKRNQSGGNSSVWYEVARKESLSSSVRYKESSRRDFVRPVLSRTKRELDFVRWVPVIMREGLRPSVTKSRERTASPRPAGTTNQAGKTTSLSTKSHRESLSTFVRYEESLRWDFIRPVRSRVIGGHVIVPLVRGIKHAGLLPSGKKSRERRACPSPSSMRNHAGWASSVWYKVVQKEGLSPSIWYEESSKLHFVLPV